MKKLFITGLFSFLICSVSHCYLKAQGENNIWYFGVNAGLDFNSGFPVVLTDGIIQEYHYNISVSDSLGNLLFYADNYRVYNRNHEIMPNGSGIGVVGAWARQPLYAVQRLTDDSSYYLFTVDAEMAPGYPNPNGLRYSIIDMRLDGGLGDIVPGFKNIQIPGGEQAAIMLTGTKHKNNRFAWIVSRKCPNSYHYLSYRIDSSGIITPPVLSNSQIMTLYPVVTSNAPEIIRISPAGTKLVALYDTVAEFCDFNPQTGEITPLFCFKSGALPTISYGEESAEFSVDGKYLYVHCDAGSGMGRLFQYDAQATDSLAFFQSEILIASDNTGSALIRGPDNKLYCTVKGKDSLNVIHNPSVQGTGCNYQRNAICLNGKFAYWGLPQSLQRYYLYITHFGQCAGDSINFSFFTWPPADSISWNFGDPGSGTANNSSSIHPRHCYLNPGNYTVILIVRHEDQRFDTAIQTVIIKETPKPLLGPDRTICQGDSVTFDAGPWPGCSYSWTELIFSLQVGNGQALTTCTAGIYEVMVSSPEGCTGKDTVQLFISPPPILTNNPLAKEICTGESTNIVLTSNTPGATFNWTATLTAGTVTGFSADSGFVINQMLINTTAFPGVVTYHVIPKIGSCTGDTSNFAVTVNPGDSVLVFIVADTNNICAGIPVTFTATPNNGGANPAYQWKVNGIVVGGNSPVYSYTPVNGDVVICVLTSSNITCTSNNPATSSPVIMVINSNLVIGVIVTASANPVCSGIPVTFTATPTNGGTTPVYQWKVNGVSVGGNSPVYTYTPANGDNVICVLTSSEICTANNPVTSSPVIMVINSNLVVGVTIAASANPVCEGIPVTFTATPVNGGPTPFYQWKVNGLNAGINDSTYTYTPSNGDSVICVLTSSEICTANNPVTSSPVIMVINSNLIVAVTIAASANPVCTGTSVTYTATPVNGGTSPTYQWKVNGTIVGTNSPVFTYTPANGDLVICVLTSSESCTANNPVTSSPVIMVINQGPVVIFSKCNDTITTTNAKPFKLKGGIPLSGTYSGPGVNPATGIWDPASAGVGNKTITYSYTNAALCSSSASRVFKVVAAPAFTCGNILTDVRDNSQYQTVQIGTQCWLAENLNYGTEIPDNLVQLDNCIPEKYSRPSSLVPRPSYYQWDELMQYSDNPGEQGLCPPSWHIPTEAEWQTLFSVYNGPGFAASPLLSSGFSGFNAMVNGSRFENATWQYDNFATHFWTSTSWGSLKAWAHAMNNMPDDHSVSMYPSPRSNALSVRCLKD